MGQQTKTVKERIVRAAHRAYDSGLQRGNGGNLSERVPGEQLVVIKPSGCSLGECTPDNLVTVDFEGRVVDGQGKPSRELRTHLAVYRRRVDVLGIFHCHSPWAIAASEHFEELPLHAYHAREKIGSVPILAVDGHADSTVVSAVRELLAKHEGLKAFIQRKHGIFALAENVELAEHHAELVEETAQIAWLLRSR